MEYFPDQTSAIFCGGTTAPDEYVLPADWYARLRGERDVNGWTDYDTRRAAEDAAALAFTKLSARRRAEFLAPEKPAAQTEKVKPRTKKAKPAAKAKAPAKKPKARRGGKS